MMTIYNILQFLLSVLWFFVLAHVIMSWLIGFDVLNRRQAIVSQIWDGLTRILEPIYRPIRNILPPTGGLDLAPLMVFIGIMLIRIVLDTNRGFFMGY